VIDTHSIRRELVETGGISFGAACVTFGLHGPLHRLNVSMVAGVAIGVGVTFVLFRGPGILIWHRFRQRVYRRFDPVFWSSFLVFAASGLFSATNMRLVQVLGSLLAALLYVIGCRRTRDWYFAKAEKAVTAQRCPTHGKTVSFEVRMNGRRPYMWVEGCCEEARNAAKAAVQEVFCS
jgi:hypothetical protein